MRAQSKLETVNVSILLAFGLPANENLDLRLANILLTVSQVVSQLVDGESRLVCLRSHKSESGLEDSIGEILVEHAHVLPEIIPHPLHGDGAVGHYLTSSNRHEMVVISFTIFKGHIFQKIFRHLKLASMVFML